MQEKCVEKKRQEEGNSKEELDAIIVKLEEYEKEKVKRFEKMKKKNYCNKK